jgi:hypothetical protein
MHICDASVDTFEMRSGGLADFHELGYQNVYSVEVYGCAEKGT